MEARCWSRSLQKRAFDVVVSTLALTFTSPIVAVVWVTVRLTSAGPVLFRQERVGLDGKLFTVYKFRTMAVDESGSGPRLTRDGDHRLTRIGKILRKSKVDEIPQFYNVLRGDMSLVGPRPKLPEYSVASDWHYRPGITGLATLAFRQEEKMLKDIPHDDVEEFYQAEIRPLKARLDRWYMRRASIASDLAIIWRTANACLAPDSLREPRILSRRTAEVAKWVGDRSSIGVALETESVD